MSSFHWMYVSILSNSIFVTSIFIWWLSCRWWISFKPWILEKWDVVLNIDIVTFYLSSHLLQVILPLWILALCLSWMCLDRVLLCAYVLLQKEQVRLPVFDLLLNKRGFNCLHDCLSVIIGLSPEVIDGQFIITLYSIINLNSL